MPYPWGQGGEFVYPEGVKPLLFHVEKKPVEVIWGSDNNASCAAPSGGILDLSNREQTSGQTQTLLNGLHIPPNLGKSQESPL